MERDHLTATSQKAVQTVASEIQRRLKARTRPLVVSMDGGSGAGKSTLAAPVASEVGATVVQCDDFYAATVTDAEWDRYTPEQKCRRCIDWRRMRHEVVEPLLAGRIALYQPYSLTSANGLAGDWVRKEPAPVIILDGIYSALPEVSDLVDFTVLVDVAPGIRCQRHNLREGHDDAAWHARWDPAEDYYFTRVRPRSSFDLVVTNT